MTRLGAGLNLCPSMFARPARSYVGKAGAGTGEVVWDFIQSVWSSKAGLAIAPLQDVLASIAPILLGIGTIDAIPPNPQPGWALTAHISRIALLIGCVGESVSVLAFVRVMSNLATTLRCTTFVQFSEVFAHKKSSRSSLSNTFLSIIR